MTTAIIYSGEARTFGQVFENHYWHLLRKLPNPEFFVSVQADAHATDMMRLWEKFPQSPVHIEHVKQPEIVEPPPEPKWLNLYPPSSPPQAILRQLWSLNRAWEFFNGFTSSADIVIRIRPDLAFVRFDQDLDALWRALWSGSCYTPWWARWGGVNDRFAIMGRRAAEHYFTTFAKLDRLRAEGCPFHPEQLIAASLEDGEITLNHTLAANFVTVRLDGTTVPMSITELDSIDYARSR